jgi:hypothetical protein
MSDKLSPVYVEQISISYIDLTDGVLEYWSVGVLEYWSVGVLE